MRKALTRILSLALARTLTLTPSLTPDQVQHIAVCCSPVGESFRNYVRMLPALVSCTTIDWFTDWPADAL